MPWQQHAVDVALEVDPETGDLWYEEVVITVPRQSGKTTLILAILVWRCVVMARRLGSQTCTYLAQSGKMARRKLEREFAPILRGAKSLREIPQLARQRPDAPNEWKLSMNNGSEHILFGTQSYLQIEAPTGTGSHGDVLDMPVIDEAFAHQDDLVEQAVDAATVTRRSPQAFVISTAGNAKSIYLARKVLAGRKAISDPVSRTCYLEWSVPDELPFDDPAIWAQYLPALGHTITEQRLLARLDKATRNPDEADEDGFEPGVAGFRRGYLNQWPEFPDLTGTSSSTEVDPAEWAKLTDPRSQIVGAVVLGVGVAWDGASAAICVAGRTAGGRIQVETVEKSPKTWWIENHLSGLIERNAPAAVAWDHGGPTRVVYPELARAITKSTVTEESPLTGREWSAACEAFRNAIAEKRIVHLGDLWLQDALGVVARRETTTGWQWDYKASRGDIAPLIAATAAVRALESLQEAPVTYEKPLVAFR